MSSRLDFIVDANSTRQDRILQSYTTPGKYDLTDLVRNDQVIAYSVQPVVINPPGSDTIYTADYETTDVFRVAIGDIDEPAEDGTIALQVGATTSGLDALAYNITAAALETALNAALTTEAEPLCDITLVEAGVYQIDAVSNGAIIAGFFAVVSDALLQPDCDSFFMEQSLGTASSRYQVFLVIRQAPTAYSEPTTALTTAGVTITTTQSGSATANKIQKISFDAAQTYGGTYRISGTVLTVVGTCGIAMPTMEAGDLGAILTGHPQIHYQDLDDTADNIVVTKSGADFFVEFVGTAANSDAQVLTVTNIDLIAPLGRSGTLNLNTVSLYRKSLLEDGDTFIQKFSIQRERATGEIRTLILVNITIKKEIIDVASMVPTPRPSYYTSAATDALLVLKQTKLLTYTSISGTTTILEPHQILDATSGTFTATLPTAALIIGKWYMLKNSGSGVVTLDGFGAETIDGSATQTLIQYDSLMVVSNGTNWIIV